MAEMHKLTTSRSRTMDAVEESVRLPHTDTPYWDEALHPLPGEVVVHCDQLLLTRQRVIGSDGQHYDKHCASYPNGAMSTTDEEAMLTARHKRLCDEGTEGN